MRAVALALITAVALNMIGTRQDADASALQAVAERYVRLVLAVGRHDADYVDAYYGPPAWRPASGSAPRPLSELRQEAASLLERLAPLKPGDELTALRHEYLTRQLQAVDARLRMLQGERLSFDEESRALYDAVAPVHQASEFQATLRELDRRLPGTGTLIDRYDAYRRRFVVPPDRLSRVFEAALEACRERTRPHVALPAAETFTLEYVTDQPWSGYNWYQGNLTSLIQINTDLPIYVDRAIHLACHEGYPGHHVYNALLEEHLVRRRGWMEFTVYPLFSPQSLIAEGTANFGVEVAFPDGERAAFERDRLFPLAGLEPALAAGYYEVLDLVERLKYAENEAARQYLDGAMTREQATGWLEQYAMIPRTRAEHRLRFIDRYRSYVINYNLGKDLVRAHVEALGGTADRPEQRWAAFVELLSSPRLPSGLRR